MHKIKTVLRLACLGLSQRQIALSCQLGQATVSDYLRMAAAAGLKWSDIADWDEDRLRSAGACLDPGAELAQDRRPRLRRDPARATDPQAPHAAVALAGVPPATARRLRV